MALFDQRSHVAEQQSEKQGCDVLTVDVGVGHDDDLAVAELFKIKVFTDTGTERCDE